MPKVEEGRLNIRNRDSFKQFIPSPIEHYKTRRRVKSVRFVRISHDEKYKSLKAKHQQ